MNAQQLITEHIDLWTSSIKAKNTQGRGSSKKRELYGVKKLRELILELAVRGKLVTQDPNDEPARVLLDLIAAEKAQLIKDGKHKKTKRLPEISEEQMLLSLPAGWKYCRLSDAYDVRDGTHDSPRPQPTGFPLVTSKNLSSGMLDLSNVKFITLEDHQKIQERSSVDVNDILFAMIGSIGNPVLVDTEEKFSIKNVALFKYYQNQLSNPQFLRYSLIHASKILKSEASGAVQSFVSLGVLRSFVVALPPLSEQHRIVTKVDELMALCDQLEQQTESSLDAHNLLVDTLLSTLTDARDANELSDNWARLADHFDTLITTDYAVEQLKQTILQLAVQGKLVPQDPNDEPASELLKRIAAEKAQLIKDKRIKKQKPLPKIGEEDKPSKLPEGWTFERLNNFTIVGTGATPSRSTPSYWEPRDINWVSSGETSALFLGETKEKVSALAVKETNVSVYPVGTLIVAMYGQGKTRGQVTELTVEAGTNQACAAIRMIDSSEYHRLYVKLFFQKSYFELREQAAGGAQPNLNVGKISEMILLLPPLEEQHRIVTKVAELMALCDQLKTQLNDSQTTQLHLADAIIAQAIN